eukprot:CAMPEP_0171085698 /NCGR_PEP_ID=MMETSP0766_2-20121228/19086_1 /TAXON_ID=439317 /ORGANISM="Gambierdiscus australes, Strain CAWD 149" /LENGTH=566 /DNA_ID=CAMNT_0011543285 /DNA_START=57 /DNA_END=1756 /DNA_ORIENTATION=-
MAQLWEVVGGADKGGILVREGEATASAQASSRLSTGALIEEIELKGERLNYKLLSGTGPELGWISIKLPGKDLAVRTDKTPPKPRQPPPTAVGPNNEEPLPIALFFPGQGSQYVKMMSDVKDMPAVKEMLEKAGPILGYDILDICLNGPEEKLEETKYCQPAMFIGGLAGLEKLKGEKPEAVTRASVMAGLSLGEYTALCAAGVMSFEDGLKLVKLRGEAMQEAAAIGKQLMLSVAGLEKDKLQPLCVEAAKKEGAGSVCQIANCLFPGGFSVGGTEKAITLLKDMAEKAGALQAKVLKTAGAFHTPLMKPAQDKLAAALEETLPNMKPPMHTIWMNATAEPLRPGCDPADIVANLKTQLTNPVLWDLSCSEILKEGVTEFYEVGPMKQIKAMMKRINVGAWKKTTNIEAELARRAPCSPVLRTPQAMHIPWCFWPAATPKVQFCRLCPTQPELNVPAPDGSSGRAPEGVFQQGTVACVMLLKVASSSKRRCLADLHAAIFVPVLKQPDLERQAGCQKRAGRVEQLHVALGQSPCKCVVERSLMHSAAPRAAVHLLTQSSAARRPG